jgi:hypothetical protein
VMRTGGGISGTDWKRRHARRARRAGA